MLSKAGNFLAYQLTWFAAVLGAASPYAWIGPSVAALALALHLWLVPDRATALRIVLLAGLPGYLTDSVLGSLGVFEFRGGASNVGWLAPFWLLGLWLVFATTLRSSLGWLADRSGLAAFLGAVVGPVSYYAGDRFGALHIGEPLMRGLLLLALVWSLLLPLLFVCSREQRPPRRSPV